MVLLSVIFFAFAAALLPGLIRGRLRDGLGWLFAILPGGFTLIFLRLLPNPASTTQQVTIPWAPSLGLSFSLRLDGLSSLFALLISGIGTLVVIYAGAYLKGDERLGRFYTWLFIFMASMLGVVLADNLILLFVFWELTSLSSYFLIGYYHDEEASRAAAWQALITTGAGGLALLAGLVLLGQAAGSYELSAVLSAGSVVQSSRYYLPILVLILLGAFTKSAQFPFHYWLPNAMQAPTPVSAYLHSATMVKAGVYLLARLSPLLGGTQPWLLLVGGIGGFTMLGGGFLSLLYTDLKRVLAYSTVSALGMMVFLIGIGSSLALKTAMLLLLAHGLYKGALFLVAGGVDHESGTRDVRFLGGLRRAMPITAAAGALAGLSMAGIPPMLGFISKELFYESGLENGPWLTRASFLAASFSFYAACTAGFEPFWGAQGNPPRKAHEGPLALWLGPVALAVLGLALGLLPGPLGAGLISSAVSSALGQDVTIKLSLWHGFTPALLLSGLTVLGGAGLFLARRFLRRIPSAFAWLWGPDRLYNLAMDGLLRLANWQTRLLQNGYLRIYLSVIILATVGLLSFSLASQPAAIHFPAGEARFYEIILAAVVVLAILAAVRSRSRLAAVAAVGMVGYGLAVIYLFYGAPDLAMIQFAIETLTVILLVLVIYRLPRFTRLSSPPVKLFDILLALSAGALMSALVLVIASYPLPAQLTEFFVANSLPLAKGRNIVNVILVDFRGLDTLGEITVLATAAVGVYALIRLVNPVVKQQVSKWKKRQVARSPILQTSALLLMPLLLIFSIFLLLRGHNDLGGGFSGGVVASAGFMLYAIAYTPETARLMLRVRPPVLIGAGLLAALSSGVLSVLAGRAFMTGLWLPQEISIVGKIGTPILFDLGVYLVVVGVSLHMLLTLMED